MVTTISIIVPVFNEAQNILPLVKEVGAYQTFLEPSYLERALKR